MIFCNTATMHSSKNCTVDKSQLTCKYGAIVDYTKGVLAKINNLVTKIVNSYEHYFEETAITETRNRQWKGFIESPIVNVKKCLETAQAKILRYTVLLEDQEETRQYARNQQNEKCKGPQHNTEGHEAFNEFRKNENTDNPKNDTRKKTNKKGKPIRISNTEEAEDSQEDTPMTRAQIVDTIEQCINTKLEESTGTNSLDTNIKGRVMKVSSNIICSIKGSVNHSVRDKLKIWFKKKKFKNSQVTTSRDTVVKPKVKMKKGIIPDGNIKDLVPNRIVNGDINDTAQEDNRDPVKDLKETAVCVEKPSKSLANKVNLRMTTTNVNIYRVIKSYALL